MIRDMDMKTNKLNEEITLYLPEILRNTTKNFGEEISLGIADNFSYTYNELYALSIQVATTLYSLEIQAGDRAIILSENTPHWVAAWFGTLINGSVTVPILIDFQGKEIQSIVEHSGAKVIFVSSKMLPKLKEGLPSCVEHVILTDDFSHIEISKGSVISDPTNKKQPSKIEVRKDILKSEDRFFKGSPDDLASIIYTSGTTGRSKGVMLTHRNIAYNTWQSYNVHNISVDDVFVSILPLAHTYECTIGMVLPISCGAKVYYIDKAPTPSVLAPVLKKLRPTTMLTVPLIIEKIYRSKVRDTFNKNFFLRILLKIGPVRKVLYRAAGRKLMDFFGGRVRFFGIGGAPLAPDAEKFLIEAGFPYAIGYGLTETSPLLAGFGPLEPVYRSVGKPVIGIDFKLNNPDPVTGEGEIVVKGDNIMKGYYNDPERTAEVFTEDGYFRTGDLAIMNKKGIYFIKGRLKNMILGPNGENIYPEEIEAVINSYDYVNESLVLQMKGKLVARVNLNYEILEKKFHDLKNNAQDFQQHLQEKTDELLQELMLQVNMHVSKSSKLQMIILQATPFEKTPTLKIKRYLYSDM